MTAPTIRARKVIAELVDGDWFGMFDDGVVVFGPSALALLTMVRRRDAADARQGGVGIVTVLEWRDAPPGFVPPEVKV